MTAEAPVDVDVRRFEGSIGLLIDNSVEGGEVLGHVWLIDEDKVATCAHLVVLYVPFLAALSIRFPALGIEKGVSGAMFHPKFNRKIAAQLAKQALMLPVPTLALQKHNAVVLKLTNDLPNLSPDLTKHVNSKLSPPPPPRDQGMGGSLNDMDLAMVLQTITNARKEGILVISDERGRTRARIFCQSGRVMHATYRNLVNETAMYQLFSQKLTDGQFYFSSVKEPDWEVKRPITRPTDMLLIESHRRLDELEKLIQSVGGRDAIFTATVPEPNVDVMPPDLKESCRMMWKVLDGATRAGKIWQLANLDDYSVFSTLYELLITKQIVRQEALEQALTIPPNNGTGGDTPLQALPIAVQSPLAPWDRITNLTIDTPETTVLLRSGSLLGTMRELDPWHLIHNLRLLSEAAGSPMFKDGFVVGMHCGKMPPDPNVEQVDGHLQQMLWVESIMECLKGGGEAELARRLTLSGDEALALPLGSGTSAGTSAGTSGSSSLLRPNAGCKEVARIECPKCGRSSLGTSRFCKSCGHRMIQEAQDFKPNLGFVKPLAAAAVAAVVIGGIFAAASHGSMPLPNFKPVLTIRTNARIDNPEAYILPEVPWVVPSIARLALDPSRHPILTPANQPVWENIEDHITLPKGTPINVKFDVKERCHVYLFTKFTSQLQPNLIFPPSQSDDKILAAGSHFMVPSRRKLIEGDTDLSKIATEVQSPHGEDLIVILASERPSEALLKDPNLINRIYGTAIDILQLDTFADGVEVNTSVFQEMFPKDKSKPEQFGIPTTRRNTIYLRLLKIKHSD